MLQADHSVIDKDQSRANIHMIYPRMFRLLQDPLHQQSSPSLTPKMPMLQSSLKLRATYNRLRKCTGRRKVLFQLLFPIPWHFRTPALPSPSDYHATEKCSFQPNILQLHNIPLYRIPDTPLRSLYRLYEDLSSGNLIMMETRASTRLASTAYRTESLSRVSGIRESSQLFSVWEKK